MSSSDDSILNTPEKVMYYWFGTLDHIEMNTLNYINHNMPIWFGGKSLEFDERQKQNTWLIDYLGRNDLNDSIWIDSSVGKLSRIIVLDQFTRCVYRGQAKAFQYDPLVSLLVKEVMDLELLYSYAPIQRFFVIVEQCSVVDPSKALSISQLWR